MTGRFQTIRVFALLITVTLLFSGCYNTRFLNDGEILFKANKIELDTQDKIEKQRSFEKDIAGISQLQPNKKFLGLFKTRLWFHNVASRAKMNKFRYWMKDKAGEPPSLYDALQAEKSTVLMTTFLRNKGFFHAKVDFETSIKRKKATVTYYIEAGERYYLRSVSFPEDTGRISRIIARNKEDSFLKPGDPFDVANMKSERDRITDLLRNQGYYLFNKEFVYFDIDSSNSPRQLDLSVKINRPTDTTEHKIFYIDQIYIFTNYSLEQLRFKYDTDTVDILYYHFITDEMKYTYSLKTTGHVGQGAN